MKTIKVSELTGAALDWVVAKCEGWRLCDKHPPMLKHYHPNSAHTTRLYVEDLPYSTDWAQGGPIIEREEISISREFTSAWAAWASAPIRDEAEAFGYGPTPLVAAMRCYVASKLGDEVEVPEELE
jgi:hypothetical protein